MADAFVSAADGLFPVACRPTSARINSRVISTELSLNRRVAYSKFKGAERLEDRDEGGPQELESPENPKRDSEDPVWRSPDQRRAETRREIPGIRREIKVQVRGDTDVVHGKREPPEENTLVSGPISDGERTLFFTRVSIMYLLLWCELVKSEHFLT